MPENFSRLAYLYDRFISDTATPNEVREFWTLWNEGPEHSAVHEMVFRSYNDRLPENMPVKNWDAATAALQTYIAQTRSPVVPFVRRYLLWVAAATVILLAGALYLLIPALKVKDAMVVAAKQDIAPGHNGAILTLSNGSSIVLDSIHNGQVAEEGGTRVIKENGVLNYQPGSVTSAVVYNTIHTPRGRQFQLVLPDGTKVWLNAASSISYPASFTGRERKVTITGEAYFEVATLRLRSGQKIPFKVNVRNSVVEVLGTHFNIMAYDDEQTTKTTLLEGSVRIERQRAESGDVSVILKPGEQAVLSQSSQTSQPIPVQTVDAEQAIAWKNGLFNFTDADLDEVMKQISRWYDLDIIYEKEIPEKQFWGKMSRNVSLAGLLKGLSGAGVHFRIEEGRRLVVMP